MSYFHQSQWCSVSLYLILILFFYIQRLFHTVQCCYIMIAIKIRLVYSIVSKLFTAAILIHRMLPDSVHFWVYHFFNLLVLSLLYCILLHHQVLPCNKYCCCLSCYIYVLFKLYCIFYSIVLHFTSHWTYYNHHSAYHQYLCNISIIVTWQNTAADVIINRTNHTLNVILQLKFKCCYVCLSV